MTQSITSLPQYRCQHIPREIELTGKLDDPLWEKAAVIHLNDAITGEPGRYQTEVRVLYSDRCLYVGFRCEDEYCWGTLTERDAPIWLEECVEIFINPANVGHQYYELNVSPLNVIFDACVLNHRTAEFPNRAFLPLPSLNLAELKTAVWIDGELNRPNGAKGWGVEYAIPLVDLWGSPNTPPQTGDSWRINFYRIDSPAKDQPEHYAWTHLGEARFHLPWRFGYLIFE
jgi:hypothetical protein